MLSPLWPRFRLCLKLWGLSKIKQTKANNPLPPWKSKGFQSANIKRKGTLGVGWDRIHASQAPEQKNSLSFFLNSLLPFCSKEGMVEPGSSLRHVASPNSWRKRPKCPMGIKQQQLRSVERQGQDQRGLWIWQGVMCRLVVSGRASIQSPRLKAEWRTLPERETAEALPRHLCDLKDQTE